MPDPSGIRFTGPGYDVLIVMDYGKDEEKASSDPNRPPLTEEGMQNIYRFIETLVRIQVRAIAEGKAKIVDGKFVLLEPREELKKRRRGTSPSEA